jgi:hypothetical protein
LVENCPLDIPSPRIEVSLPQDAILISLMILQKVDNINGTNFEQTIVGMELDS